MKPIWSAWENILKANDYDQYVVYELRLVNLSKKPIEINRFLKPDKNGILYIGERRSMKSCILDVKAAIKEPERHMAGILIHYLFKNSDGFKRYLKTIGVNKMEDIQNLIEYRFIKVNSKALKKKVEEYFIKDYVKEFGEPPPLNSTIPKRNESWALNPFNK